MDSSKIKEAFARAKQDIQELRAHLESITHQLEEIKQTLQQSSRQTNQQTDTPTQTSRSPTTQQISPTHIPADSSPTDELPPYSLKTSLSNISTGNRGVPTDRQTNQQTDRHSILSTKIPQKPNSDALNRIFQAFESLDEFRQDLRRQFKSLTAQEFLVFSTLYQLEEEGNLVDYPLMAARLKLSESSIRDYVLKLVRKGIPLQKTKHNNKNITLSVVPEFRKIASLQAILTLRDI